MTDADGADHDDSDDAERLLSSGEFARRTRLGPKALRIYGRSGLLAPVAVEPNGYRRYGAGQVRTGRLIAVLRGADVGLDEIADVVGELAAGPDAAAVRLDRLLADLDRGHRGRRLLIRHAQITLRGGDTMFPIATRHVAARRVLTLQRRLQAHETDRFVREARAAFAAHLDGAEATGPLLLIFHGVVDDESDGPIEVALGCGDDVAPSTTIGVRTEPAHDEAYTTITRSQWAYPAILAAYDAVACSPAVGARPGSPLSCREVYLADPDSLGEDDLVCDVAFPLGDPVGDSVAGDAGRRAPAAPVGPVSSGRRSAGRT